LKKKAPHLPKIMILFGALSVCFIIFLFFRPKSDLKPTFKKPKDTQVLFNHVMQAALPQLKILWEEGDQFIKKGNALNCPDEIIFEKNVGRSYFQCQPHLWQCFWAGGVQKENSLKIELYGQIYHVKAQASFKPISSYSKAPRFYEIIQGPLEDINFHYGMLVEMTLEEFPDKVWPLILTDTCRDTYLPERIYGHRSKNEKLDNQIFQWDNFNQKIFIDKFYVTNQMINEWRILRGEEDKVILDRLKWPQPAIISRNEQKDYCAFWGKRVLEAKLFDAASMTPIDLKNTLNSWVSTPQTPWQRDLSKTFLGMARINPDYQLTPLDCQLAQVGGCLEKYFSTDSVSWMGMNYALGFYPESLKNTLDPSRNLKKSSRFFSAESEVHELGKLYTWDGSQPEKLPIAFRCYEEVSL